MDDKLTGAVKFFRAKEGWGFISRDDGGMDVYVHARQLRASGIHRFLNVGERVNYSLEQGERGPYAVSISVDEAPAVKAEVQS